MVAKAVLRGWKGPEMKTIIPPMTEQADPPSEHHQRPKPDLANIRRELRADGVVVLVFDRANSPVNIFDPDTLAELENHLDEVTADSSVRALVLTSAKRGIFVAGADLDFVSSAVGDELTEFIESGQRVFSRLAALRVPTVATIDGACLGGGLELALACDYRIASPDKSTKIGLPETQLGILPAWGGSTRLPRLIGLTKALGLILGGKILTAAHAKKLGVIDALAPRERLVDFAVALIDAGKVLPKRSTHWLTNNRLVREIVQRKAHANAAAKTRGNYPAIASAIDVICNGLAGTVAESLELERRAVIELSTTNAAKQLMRVFHLQENAKKFHVSDASASDINRAAVIGAGVMGAGIAHWLSSRKIPTVMQDIDEEKVGAGMKRIGKLYADGAKRRLFSPDEARRLIDRISPAVGSVPLEHADLVIEAAVENLAVKKTIFAELCGRVRPDTVLATNTSALPIGELANDSRISHPERIVGLHFFNPVHRMKLVEIVVTERTSPEVVETALRFARKIGKLPVVVKDSPGFLVNRILMPYLIEAGRLFDRGVDAREIDEAMLDFGMPMGPLRLLDEVGLDVAMHVSSTMAEAFGDRFAAPPVLKRLVDKGLLGRKSGEGFFVYGKGDATVSEKALACRATAASQSLKENDIAERLSLLMVNEGFRVLDEGVAASGDDVDFAMILGTGFAPFRGGPITYAHHLGLEHVVDRLNAIGKSEAEIFEPAAGLVSAASK